MSGLTIGGKAADDASLLKKPHVDRWAPQKAALGLDKPAPVVVPRLTTFPSAQAAADELGTLMAEAHGLETQRRAAEAARERLAPKIADPALYGHPKRPAAVARFDALRDEARTAAGRIEAIGWLMARIWAGLPAGARTELLPCGWWQGADPEGFRRWIEACLAVGWMPGEEAPF